MSDAQRCEPPEHREYLVALADHIDRITWRGRYYHLGGLAPVAPPDLVRALVEALVECSDDLEAYVNADNEHASRYPAMEERRQRDLAPVLAARAVLHRAKEAGV